jgi:hypothetical protein
MKELVTFEFEDDLYEAVCQLALRRGTTVEQVIIDSIEKLATEMLEERGKTLPELDTDSADHIVPD